jgi:Mce-associated membrane protein
VAVSNAVALAEQAEAEADEAEAVAEAAGARLQGIRERRQVSSKRGRLGRPSWRAVAMWGAIIGTVVLLATSGYIVWQHHDRIRENQRTAEFAAAARQGVVTLMSLNFNTAKDDVARIVDNSTGGFRKDLESAAAEFTKMTQDSKAITEANVSATAVQSMMDNQAVVLVTASSTIADAAGAKEAPRSWRLRVTVARDGGQVKMSKVEFLQ